MDLILGLVDFILHIDRHLAEIIADYGTLTYAILFVIVFCETGLVVTPFLPGDSLLFATGAFCVERAGQEGGALQIALVVPLLMAAAILGDAVNYSIGFKVGPGFLEKGKVRFIKMEHLHRTQRFYEKHGGKTIIIARFMPIIRTFAPFVAGIGRMQYRRFAVFNVSGAVAWVISFTLLGYFFGNLPVVKRNFTLVIGVIILISITPMVIEIVRARRERRAAASG
jgi:membrane-associated protein